VTDAIMRRARTPTVSLYGGLEDNGRVWRGAYALRCVPLALRAVEDADEADGTAAAFAEVAGTREAG
jgi:hypothetical protein